MTIKNTEILNFPLILTLALDAGLQTFCEQQRVKYFPKALNKIPAHVSLFHQLPSAAIMAIDETLQNYCTKIVAPDVSIDAIQSLGRGTAYRLNIAINLHQPLAAYWQDWLIPQDRQRWRPHITIQNKVTPEIAKNLQTQLQKDFVLLNGKAIGLKLWYYCNGPWQLIKSYSFS